jgi:hypothetical protein
LEGNQGQQNKSSVIQHFAVMTASIFLYDRLRAGISSIKDGIAGQARNDTGFDGLKARNQLAQGNALGTKSSRQFKAL